MEATTREGVTIKKTAKGFWMIKFDDYEQSFSRTSKEDALERISNARERGDLYSDDVVRDGSISMWGYFN
jgi:hypothetical protein